MLSNPQGIPVDADADVVHFPYIPFHPPFFAAGLLDPVNSSQCVQNHNAEEC